MLAWSRSHTIEISLMQFEPIVQDAIELVRSACDRKKIVLTSFVESELPPIPIDGTAILQVLLNLLNNAIEAAPSETGKISIEGLGLAVARKIINEHQGTIDVQGIFGGGTAFQIVLPLHYDGDPSDTRGPATVIRSG